MIMYIAQKSKRKKLNIEQKLTKVNAIWERNTSGM